MTCVIGHLPTRYKMYSTRLACRGRYFLSVSTRTKLNERTENRGFYNVVGLVYNITNNNNNNLTCKAPVCAKKTSVALI